MEIFDFKLCHGECIAVHFAQDLTFIKGFYDDRMYKWHTIDNYNLLVISTKSKMFGLCLVDLQ